MKAMGLKYNDNGTMNLSIERDSGNIVTILMSNNPVNCEQNWKQLRTLCDTALNQLHTVITNNTYKS